MNTGVVSFGARVNLPCRLFCGPDEALELSARAMMIDIRTLVVQLHDNAGDPPATGEKVRVELSLPANGDPADARFLTVRARVLEIRENAEGSHRVVLTFRKPSFVARVEEARRKPPKKEATKWAM